MMKISNAVRKPSARPASAVLVDFHISSASPSAEAKEKASSGPSSGAITIAPTTTATLSAFMPSAATIAESRVRTRKTESIFVPSATS